MTDAATAVAAHGLPTIRELPSHPLSDDEFASVLSASERHRIVGFLGAAVGAGALPVTVDQRAQVEEMLQGWCAHALRAEHMLLRALDVLEGVGVRSRVLKGVALAHTVYREPEQRVFGDVDLLIPSADVDRAVQALSRELDAPRALPELRPGFDAHFGKEVMLRYTEQLELDLHRIFVDGALGLTIVLDDLFAPPYRFPLAGYELAALPMPQRLLHACYVAALGDWPPRLVSLRDVVELVLREKPNLLDVVLMARSWRCEVVVARAVSNAWEELGVTERPPIVEWAHRYEPTRLDRLLLAAHEGPARMFTRHLAAVVVLPGVAERARYAGAIAFPQRAYLEARGSSVSRHAKRAVSRVLR